MAEEAAQFKEAEEAVLGAVLADPSNILEVQRLLRPQDFESQANAVIYQTLCEMADANHPIEYPSLVSRLRADGTLSAVGGEQAITRILSSGFGLDWQHYGAIVKDQAGMRRLRDLHVMGLEQVAPGADHNYDTALDTLYAEVSDMVAGSATGEGLQKAASVLSHTINAIEDAGKQSGQLLGVPTGFTDVDAATTGFQPGQMIVIAARPGYGKSTLGLDIVRSAALNHGVPTAFFSLEMSKTELMQRLISAEAAIDLGAVRSGKLTDDDWTRIQTRFARIDAAPLHIDDTPGMTMAYVKAEAHKMRAKHGLGLIVIDYLQLMDASGNHQSREQQVSAISRAVKLTAKELGVPIIVMAQLNRGAEHRGRPALSDLRESGSIEQDADIVILIHREDKNAENPTRVGEADLMIAKQRNGPTLTVPVSFQGHYSRFMNITYQPEPEPASSGGW